MIQVLIAALLSSVTAFATGVMPASLAALPDQDDVYVLPCRDCGFPMRVGENRWKMQNGYVELEIKKRRLPNNREEIKVTLIDTRHDRVLAEGVSNQRRGRVTIDVEMRDYQGSAVQGYVHYIGSRRREIQVRFTCDECAILGELH